MPLPQTMIILYCSEQDRSSRFYASLLGKTPLLEVPGMTEFELCEGVLLGLMPEKGAQQLLGDTLPHPAEGRGIPRCELYLPVLHAEASTAKAIELGARLLSPLQPRNWGHRVAYLADPDGHILGIAEINET